MTQEEIWINHIKNSTVDSVINYYNKPAIFQNELVELINQELGNNTKIIEVGCELGVTSLLLSDYFEKTLLDLNPLAIELTEQAHVKLNKKADFIVADMFDMPIENKQFDIVFNAGVIEHFNETERTKAFREYARILKDGGVMFIAFPNHYSLPYRLAYKIRKLLKKWPYPDEYKIYELKNEINNSNLILEKRLILSKKSLMRWLNFLPPLKWFFQFLDIFYKYEGYLTVLKIRKK
ncbi:MAG: methyltransferase domain-containing protein [Sulfurovum sp.]|nr:methyltransferase domain-containing protein [Sulfurovum sp.]